MNTASERNDYREEIFGKPSNIDMSNASYEVKLGMRSCQSNQDYANMEYLTQKLWLTSQDASEAIRLSIEYGIINEPSTTDNTISDTQQCIAKELS